MNAREKQWQRLNALAGRDRYGNIAPPTAEELKTGIDRRPCPWWKTLRADGAQNPESADQRPTDTRRPKPAGADG